MRMSSRWWRVTLVLKDEAKDRETGETFRKLGRRQVEKLVTDRLDLPAGVKLIRTFTEEAANGE